MLRPRRSRRTETNHFSQPIAKSEYSKLLLRLPEFYRKNDGNNPAMETLGRMGATAGQLPNQTGCQPTSLMNELGSLTSKHTRPKVFLDLVA